MPSVAIFLNQHMPLSEVFVAHQAKSLKTYTPTLIACRQVNPSVEHDIPTFVLNKNHTLPEKIEEIVFKATGFSPRLRNEVQKHDIIHAHFGPTGWIASHLAVQTKKPLIVTLHGSDVLKRHLSFKDDGAMQVLYSKTRPLLYKRTSKFICVSEYLKKRVIELGFPEEKCVVSYMGIPLKQHTELKYIREHNSTDPFRILAVGRLVKMKGHEKLIAAIAAVQQAGYNVQLDIVGNGPLRDVLEKQASESLQHYKFWGGQPHNQIISLMRQSDILCHSSIEIENGQTEAFGLVVTEAQWAGLPVVAFKSGGVPEALDDGKTGILCPEGDVMAMKNAICKLIDDNELRMKLSAAAPEFIKQKFDNYIQTSKIEDIYSEILLEKNRE